MADAPSEFETRLRRILENLRQLTVLVPQRHDLVLIKAVRAHEHDLEVIVEIHARYPLELETLVARWEAEMRPIGHPIRIRGNFLTVVKRVFPASINPVASRLESSR